MIVIESQNLNTASIEACRHLLSHGIPRKTRGFDCIELPQPVAIVIENPYDRYVNIPGRKASKTLPFAESLAILSGVNSMDLYAGYVPNMIQYSDDGLFQRAGYGPRMRRFIGLSGNYAVSDPFEAVKENPLLIVSDQFRYCYETLKKDPSSRQAVISITDPGNDQLNSEGELIQTKDIPCCRLLQFMIVEDKLNMTAYFRSNDVLFGFQQVNVFNNTFIQECLANLLGVQMGPYTHIANNLHYYEDKAELVELTANQKIADFVSKFDWKGYNDDQMDLNGFDTRVSLLENMRRSIKSGQGSSLYFKENFFDDWSRVFERFHTKDTNIHFKNPYINNLFNNQVRKPGAEYVKVLQEGDWVFYEVYKPTAYLNQCHKDGKVAKYAGRADKYGYLNQ